MDAMLHYAVDKMKKTVGPPSRFVASPYLQMRQRALRFCDRRGCPTIGSFVAIQIKKTIRRPSRILEIPFLLMLHLFARGRIRVLRAIGKYSCKFGEYSYKMLLPLGLPVPIAVRKAEAIYLYSVGEKLLGQNKPDEAWHAFRRCLKYSDEHFHFTLGAVCLYVAMGRMREAIPLFQKANRIRRRRLGAISGSGSWDKYCVLDGFWPPHIGHTANIDYVIKSRALERCDPENTILYVAPETNVANRFLLDQWKPHLRLISDPRDLPFPQEYVQYLALNFYVPSVVGPGRYFLWESAAHTYRRWAKEGRKPLLQLPSEIRERGRRVLAGLGVPNDAWFVSLHVREPGFASHHRELHQVLNANVVDYLPAIDEIARRGGWIIRMGDPSMSRMPVLPNVVDYCHSSVRSDWMDVFLAAACRFFVGTPSGVCYVAHDYGVPCVWTNHWPPAQRPWQPADIFVPKLLRRAATGQSLSLDETLNEPFGYCNSMNYLRDRHGVTVIDNDPQEIRAAVVEMLDRLDGRLAHNQSDLAMLDRAEGIYASAAMKQYDSTAAFGAAKLARDFLRNNPSFLAT